MDLGGDYMARQCFNLSFPCYFKNVSGQGR